MQPWSKQARWTETHCPAISAVHFLGKKTISAATAWIKALHPDIFSRMCQKNRAPDIDILATRFNNKPPLYTFPLVRYLPCLLQKIELDGKMVIFIEPNWPIRAWYIEILRLLLDDPWFLPNRQCLLSQGYLFHPASHLMQDRIDGLNGIVVESQVLKDTRVS